MPPPSKAPERRHREKISPARAVGIAAINAATTPAVRRRLKSSRAIAVVVEVPGTGWVKVIEKHFAHQVINWSVFARDGSERHRHKPDVGNDEVCRDLGGGRHVVGIAANLAILPSALLPAADITIRIRAPSGAVVREAMRLCLNGRMPTVIDDSVVAGLELEDIVGALRSGSKPAEAVERLVAAARQRAGRDSVGEAPDLQTAIEYGAARDWGLALARDIAAFKAGRLAWRECDRGAVVYSDPGCGKSVLAGSIARACGIPLIRSSVAELFATSEGDLGAVIKAQRAVFARAAAIAPCLLFLDEIDAMPNRATLSSRNRDWWMPVINDWLLLLDSAVSGQREGIVVLGATNRIEAVDPAMLRPGRLERAIEIQRPNVAGIINMLRYQLYGDLANDDLTDIAGMLDGATAAQIMDVVRTARRAARQAGHTFALEHLRTVAFGEAASEDAAFLRRAAIHEAGHAVIGAIHRPGSVVRVSLQSQGSRAGSTTMRPPAAPLLTLEFVEQQVVEALAGGEAERVILGSATSGSGGSEDSDVANATRVIAALHASTTLAGAPIYLCPPREATELLRVDHSLRASVQQHMERLMARAGEMVRRHQAAISTVADELVRRRILTGADVEAVMKEGADNRVAAPAPDQ